MKDTIQSAALLTRAATASDAETIGGYGAELIALHHALDSSRFIEATARTPSIYAHYLKDQAGKADSLVQVAEREGKVVGYVFARIEGPDYMALRGPAGVIHDLFVTPEHRGKGAGGALLADAVAWIGDRGAPRVVLSSAYSNTSAQRLFAAMGFRPSMVEMTRDLDPTLMSKMS